MSSFLEDYRQLDAIGLAELIEKGDVSVEEVLNTAIDQVERLNPMLNAVVTTTYDEARADLQEGLPAGRFRGVPILLKDLSADLKGVPTRRGSHAFQQHIPDEDSEVVSRYRQSGMVAIGKTNTPEFGLSVTTEPLVSGPTRNPWNLECSAGGSSGGSAAAVAARIVPVAHSTDGGGSIRIPASCCGVFGLKPTRGRVSAGPISGEGWAGMSAAHVISRSVRDSATLLDLVAGPSVGDPYWAEPPAHAFIDAVSQPAEKLRILVVRQPPSGAPVSQECLGALQDATDLCVDLGHEVEEGLLPIDGEELRQQTGTVVATKTAEVLESRSLALGRELGLEDVEPPTYWLAQVGKTARGIDYARAIDAIHRIGREVAAFMESYDVILTPVLAEPPILIGELNPMTQDPEAYFDRLGRYAPFTNFCNVTGQPAMSVPLYWSPNGLPIGSQFVGRYGDEITLFRLAAQLEQARPWHDRRPQC